MKEMESKEEKIAIGFGNYLLENYVGVCNTKKCWWELKDVEKEYSTKQVYDIFIEEKQIEATKANAENLKKMQDKYEACEKEGGHDYRASGGKYSSVTQQTCVDCGKTID